jgi:hypothetical protein
MSCRRRIERGPGPGGDPRNPSRPAPHATRSAPRTRFAPRGSQTAFSLLEVMIAGGIFFMAIFAILAMVSSVLRNARSLRRTEVDASMAAALICNTNKLEEGIQSGDFGKAYPDCSWEADTYEVETNGLWQVDIVVHRRGLQKPLDEMSILLFRPESQAGFGRSRFR